MGGVGSRGRRSTLGSLTLGGLLSGCASLAPSEAALPIGATEIPVSASYQDWHTKTQECSGLSGELSTIKFYVVPGVDSFPTSQGFKVGEWTSKDGISRIVIAGNYQRHEMVVSHELLHSLLRREGHPTEFFVDRCHLTWESWNGPQGAAGAQLDE